MSRFQGVFEAHRRARFMRPDAARYMRPDGARWVRPDVARFLVPGSDPADVFAALDLKFNPTQRRIPRGQPGGGRWTDEEASEAADQVDTQSHDPVVSTDDFDRFQIVDLADDNDISVSLDDDEEIPANIWDVTDAELSDRRIFDDENDHPRIIRVGSDGKPILDEFGQPYYSPGGHHVIPRRLFENWNLPPETLKVFEEATMGKLPKGYFKIGPDNELWGHYWDQQHREYTGATKELSQNLFGEKNITDTSKMTPDQARELVERVRLTEVPAIRSYNSAMRLLGRVLRIGGGRGNE
jgi:hypothetical protein